MAKKSQKKDKIADNNTKSPDNDKKSGKFRYIRIAILIVFIGMAALGAFRNQFAGKVEDSLSHSNELKEIPVKGMVTMLDLGATECIPCKMMAPILAELEKAYKGNAAIVFVDVWKNPEYARKFGIRAIPTQIFFDKEGKEVFRNTGFLDKKSIIEKMKSLGVGEPV